MICNFFGKRGYSIHVITISEIDHDDGSPLCGAGWRFLLHTGPGTARPRSVPPPHCTSTPDSVRQTVTTQRLSEPGISPEVSCVLETTGTALI